MPACVPRGRGHFSLTRKYPLRASSAWKMVIASSLETCDFRWVTRVRRIFSLAWTSTVVFRFSAKNCPTHPRTVAELHFGSRENLERQNDRRNVTLLRAILERSYARRCTTPKELPSRKVQTRGYVPAKNPRRLRRIRPQEFLRRHSANPVPVKLPAQKFAAEPEKLPRPERML